MAVDQKRRKLADELYEKYGKPLEAEHQGEYVAITPDGRTILATTVREAAQKAVEALGPGSYLFKVGEKAVWRWR